MYGDNMKFMYTDTDSLVLEIIHPGKFKLEKEGIV
jgi:hypothetical protein